ncbi:MAG TPA: ester cyclase [Candidatus Bathyarchaeia archaeon]|nr:ester cyclase [Candidatus Bathyarchaeia archaeon]
MKKCPPVLLLILLCASAACLSRTVKTELEQNRAEAKLEEANKAVIKLFFEAVNGGSAEKAQAAVDATFRADIVTHMASGEAKGIDQVRNAFKYDHLTWSDFRYALDNVVAEGDIVVVRGGFAGTQTGRVMGMPPSGKRISYPFIFAFRLENGKVRDWWGDLDSYLSMMTQLGLEWRPAMPKEQGAKPAQGAAKREDMYHAPLVYEVPGMEAAEVRRDVTYKTADGTDLKMDIFVPPGLKADARLPVVFFIHGGFIPKTTTFLPKEWGVFQSYGRLAAASGFVGVTFNHRYWDWTREGMERSFGDVRDAIEFVRSHADEYHVDADRAALWGFSGGGPHLSIPLKEKFGFVRCLVSFYGVMDLAPAAKSQRLDPEKEGSAEFSPITYLGQKGVAFPPIFIGRAGLDAPWINETVDRFIARALSANAMIEVMNHAGGRHGFDILDDDARSKEIIARAVAFIRAHI